MNDMRPNPTRRTNDISAPRSTDDSRPNSQTAPNSQPKTINIRLSLPHIQPPRLINVAYDRFLRLSKRRRILLILALLVACVVIGQTVSRPQSQAARTGNTQQNPLDMLKKGTPNYPTLVPSGKSIEKLGGWTRISPENRDPVFAYVDAIGGVAASVSQQPIPNDLKNDTDAKLRTIALASNATRTIDAGGIKVYLGASSEGPQSAIFIKDQLLILIKATAAVDDDDWKTYIDSLQ